jgi:hypothetical protein
MQVLIDSTTVSATTRHSETAQTASEAVTALVNRVEATGAPWPENPVAPGDRVMAGGPHVRGRITATAKKLARSAGNIAANPPPIRRKR